MYNSAHSVSLLMIVVNDNEGFFLGCFYNCNNVHPCLPHGGARVLARPPEYLKFCSPLPIRKHTTLYNYKVP